MDFTPFLAANLKLRHHTGNLAETVLITGASQLLTLRGAVPRRGKSLGKLEVIQNGAVLLRAGVIVAAGARKEVEALPEARTAEKLDVRGRVVLPGFVDSHTHLVHAASRAEEYELKIAGASYEEIARKGGGILSSVAKLRAASSEALKQRALSALRSFAAHGTTTIEAKSGYGLDVSTELRTLRVHRQLAKGQPLGVVSTFLAHVVPPEYRRRSNGAEEYIVLLAEKLIPEVATQRLAEFCDVFCDRGAFNLEQSQRILEAGKKHGLSPRIHAEQLSRTGAARLAVKLRAASCDHLEKITPADIRMLAESKTVATLLPGCDFHLGWKQYAPARALIDTGAIVALATGYNPGTSPTLSIPMILSLACRQLRMTPGEAIAASTINAAFSLRRDRHIGSLEAGKQADMAIFEVDDYREIPYCFGVNQCWMTLKNGKVIFKAS